MRIHLQIYLDQRSLTSVFLSTPMRFILQQVDQPSQRLLLYCEELSLYWHAVCGFKHASVKLSSIVSKWEWYLCCAVWLTARFVHFGNCYERS